MLTFEQLKFETFGILALFLSVYFRWRWLLFSGSELVQKIFLFTLYYSVFEVPRKNYLIWKIIQLSRNSFPLIKLVFKFNSLLSLKTKPFVFNLAKPF